MKTLNTYKWILNLLFLTTVLSFCVNVSFAQIQPFAPELPQRKIEVISPIQTINFGTFCLTGGSGGTIQVDWNGTVTTTGGILSLPIGQTAHPAVYAIKLCQGRRVVISFITTHLICNGVSLSLLSGPSEFVNKGEIFMTNKDCDFINTIRVGGTLTIPDNALPGVYEGIMDIDLIQE